MDTTQKVVLVGFILLVFIACVRLIYSLTVLKKLKKIEKCVEKGYGEPVSSYQNLEEAKQEFEAEVSQIGTQQVEPQVFQQPSPIQTYNIPQQVPITIPNETKKASKWDIKRQDPGWKAMMQERAAKMRAARHQKTQQDQQPQPISEEQELLRRLAAIRGQK